MRAEQNLLALQERRGRSIEFLRLNLITRHTAVKRKSAENTEALMNEQL